MRTAVQDHHTSILADLGMEHRALDSLVMCFTKVKVGYEVYDVYNTLI